MTTQTAPVGGHVWGVTRGTLLYVICAAVISGGYFGYWLIWQLKLYYLGWIVAFVVVMLAVAARTVRVPGLSRQLAPVLAWHLLLFVTAAWSPSPAETIYYASVGLVNVVAFIVAYAWRANASPRLLAGYFELQVLLILPVVGYFLITIGQLYDANFGAIRTAVASACITSLPFIIWRIRRFPSLLSFALFIGALLLIVSGQTRAGILIAPLLIVGSLSAGGVRAPKMSTILVVAGSIAVISAVAISVPAVQDAVSESLERFSPSKTSFSITSSVLDEVTGTPEDRVDTDRRLQLFVAFQSFVTHPILGGGFESTFAITRELVGIGVVAHGLPSTLLGETGLLGTAVFSWMIVRFFRCVRRRRREAATSLEREFLSICTVGMIGTLALGLFHQVDQSPPLYILLAWAYAPGWSRDERPSSVHAQSASENHS